MLSFKLLQDILIETIYEGIMIFLIVTIWHVVPSVFNFFTAVVTAELSSLTWLTNDASRHQFLVQMLKAKVS